jgi:hypothetical protein
MKKSALLVLVFTSLALMRSSFATPAPNQLPHDHLKFNAASTSYDLVDAWGDKVAVLIEAIKDKQPSQFTVTIKRPTADARTYSLLTLGVQAVLHHTKIVEVKEGSPKFALLTDAAPTKSAPLTIPATGKIGVSPDTDKVWLVAFSATKLVMVIEPLPDHVKDVAWGTPTGGFKEGHGVEPP